MRALRTQLSMAIVCIAPLTAVIISLVANSLIKGRFETYITERQAARAENIPENIAQYYNGLTNEWDLGSIHAISMYSMYDGYIIKLHDNKGGVIWDAGTHDMAACARIMSEISERMSAHGKSGEFTSKSYNLAQNGQKIGVVTVKYYGPFFLSENDFTFLNALNAALIIIGALSLVFSFAAGSFLARRITRPIRKMADIAGQIADGRYDVQFESQTKTRELHELSGAINHLAAALAKQESLRKRLTADVAHELRTPLTTLGSHIEAMIEGIWEPTPDRLKNCHEEILRLGKIVEDLERLERAESDGLKLKKAPMDLLALTKTVCENFSASLREKNQRLQIKGAETVIFADKDRIGGVITNLVSNAVKYTPEGGEIGVFIRDFPSAALFVIEDDGPGIPERELPFVFERLYRADKSRNRDTGGAGIGLALVKSVVTAHGGTVTAENVKGGGCRFTARLPKPAG